jgi:pyruvate/2-oxoglutarate dehydrogenase complex dihydrolipoamide acyltransferase (E2) component
MVSVKDHEDTGYLGAMLDPERRLVLVPLDPDQPWVAFRRMRSWMKRRNVAAESSVDLFTAPPESQGAEVIRLRTRLNRDDG